MIFQTEGAIDKILRGEKTQTRRLWKPEYSTDLLLIPDYDTGERAIEGIRNNGRLLWQVVGVYGCQPGRGKSTHMVEDYDAKQGLIRYPLRIRILELWREDVREIAHDDANAEGYESRWDFLQAWCFMHDKAASKEASRVGVLLTYEDWLDYLNQRPAERYDAVAIRFEVVK